MVQHGSQQPVAAPPDEAGHQGSYTRPDDVLEMHAADQPPNGPPLHGDPIRLESSSDGANPIWMLVGVLALVGITAFFVLIRM